MKYAPVRLPDDTTEQLAALIPRSWVSNPETVKGIADTIMSWLVRLPCVPLEGEPMVTQVAHVLSAIYVSGAGLLEDQPYRYAQDLRPHAEAVLALLRGEPTAAVDAANTVVDSVALGPPADPTALSERLILAVKAAVLEAGVIARLDVQGTPFAAGYVHTVEAKAAAIAVLDVFADFFGKRGNPEGAIMASTAMQLRARRIVKPGRLRSRLATVDRPSNGDTRGAGAHKQVFVDGTWYHLGHKVEP